MSVLFDLIRDSINVAKKSIPSIGTEANPMLLGDTAFWIDNDNLVYDQPSSLWDVSGLMKDIVYWTLKG